ncbi:MAG: ArsI/CadI family heavy metal resistance metalloenzyme [Streptosporangiaceae bacterium]|jgi:catechol 2,3-dioxygenase-like lactoylglutathione lyase family enzyme
MTGRIQLALNVDNLDESIAFYSKLFGAGPAKLRPGYANFAIAEPPLKLILMENPGEGGSLNHLGVEVADTDAVDSEQTRLAEVGLASVDERKTTCCYAKQNKFWVQGAPNGERWEIYTVLEDSPTFWGDSGSQNWDAAEAALDAWAAGSEPGSRCCGGEPTSLHGTESESASADRCC